MHPAHATNVAKCTTAKQRASASAIKLEHSQLANMHQSPNGNLIVTHGWTLPQQSYVQVHVQLRLQLGS